MTQEQRTNQRPRQKPKRKGKGAAVAAVLCFVAAIAIVGTYTFKDYRQSKEEIRIAQAEEAKLAREKAEEQSQTANTDRIVNEPETQIQNQTSDTEAAGTQTESDDAGEKVAETENAQAASGKSTSLNFTKNSKLLWPVNGNILMNYSMDKTVYFSTLDQYKYNPALVISGEVGEQVISAAPGIIKSIDKTAQTGTTVNVDLGSGYELFYGQLKEVTAKVGDHVDAKTVLGYVSEPTKYYSVEGSNVYFEMRKDGQPVNPMEYLAD